MHLLGGFEAGNSGCDTVGQRWIVRPPFDILWMFVRDHQYSGPGLEDAAELGSMQQTLDRAIGDKRRMCQRAERCRISGDGLGCAGRADGDRPRVRWRWQNHVDYLRPKALQCQPSALNDGRAAAGLAEHDHDIVSVDGARTKLLGVSLDPLPFGSHAGFSVAFG